MGLVPPAKAEAIGAGNGRSVSAQYLVCFFRKCANGFLLFPRRFLQGTLLKGEKISVAFALMSSHVNMADPCALLELLSNIRG